MTHERDIDRLLDLWIADGPSEVADRVIVDVAARIDRQPQRPAWRFLWRPTPMTSSVRWAAALVAVALIAVVGFAVFGRPSNSGVGASPSLSPSPSGSAGAGDPIPTELQARWMGSERAVPGILAGAGTTMNFTDDGRFYITQSAANVNQFLNSAASGVSDGQIRLETTLADAACMIGDVGLYKWSLSPSGRILTISATSDDCATRQGTVPGVWLLENCPLVDDNCLGSVDAGTYHSQFFAPLLSGRNSWVPDYGALIYTVPEGWANTADWPDSFDIGPQDAPTDSTNAILLHSRAVLASQAEDCPVEPLEGVARTPQAMAEWLASHPGLDASTPKPVTIGGFDGFVVDIAMAPTWTKTCPFSGGAPSLPLFTDQDPGGFHWAIGPGARMRFYLVDLGDGRLLLADIEAVDDATFQAMLPEASAIVESMEFSSTP